MHLKSVTILILIDGFLQFNKCLQYPNVKGVTILILIDGFLQLDVNGEILKDYNSVTILILIDGFLQ